MIVDRTVHDKSVQDMGYGDVFKKNEIFYIKTPNILDDQIGCVSLRSGLIIYFDPQKNVTEVNAKAVIE